MRLSLVALMLAFVALMGSAPAANAAPFWEENDKAEVSRTYKHSAKRARAVRQSIGNSEGRSSRRTAQRSGIGGRPRQWCGWWMRTQKGGGPEYNLAANWRRWGSNAGGPQVGAVVVWSHHVGMITGRTAGGQWIVKSGNDSGRVRERARSVSGAVFRVG